MVDFDPAIINKVFENTDPVEVKPEMIARFCASLGESNPLFTDPEAAKKGPYGGVVPPPSFSVSFLNRRRFFDYISRSGRPEVYAGKNATIVAPIPPAAQTPLPPYPNQTSPTH